MDIKLYIYTEKKGIKESKKKQVRRSQVRLYRRQIEYDRKGGLRVGAI